MKIKNVRASLLPEDRQFWRINPGTIMDVNELNPGHSSEFQEHSTILPERVSQGVTFWRLIPPHEINGFVDH
ncbi:MAG: hypothetical protein PHY29_11490 [Syntrophales bacterium]|nr:hypothetical protein [Syntrophales bacterium]